MSLQGVLSPSPQGGEGVPPLMEHMEPDRSSTSMATTSRREAVPLAVMVVELMLNQRMNQVGTVVVAVTETVRRLAGAVTTTVPVFMMVLVVDQVAAGKLA